MKSGHDADIWTRWGKTRTNIIAAACRLDHHFAIFDISTPRQAADQPGEASALWAARIAGLMKMGTDVRVRQMRAFPRLRPDLRLINDIVSNGIQWLRRWFFLHAIQYATITQMRYGSVLYSELLFSAIPAVLRPSSTYAIRHARGCQRLVAGLGGPSTSWAFFASA
jgi:hypothetical protein